MSRKNGHWQVNNSQLVYGNPWMQVYEDDVTDYGGVHTTFSRANVRNGVTIVALDYDNNVYLINTRRYAVQEDSDECVSGGIKEGESPLDCAKRELAEEVGAISDEWISLGTIHTFPDKLEHTESLFIAKNIKPLNNKPPFDTSEKLDVAKVPFSMAVEWVMDSKIMHSPSCVAILKAQKYLND